MSPPTEKKHWNGSPASDAHLQARSIQSHSSWSALPRSGVAEGDGEALAVALARAPNDPTGKGVLVALPAAAPFERDAGESGSGVGEMLGSGVAVGVTVSVAVAEGVVPKEALGVAVALMVGVALGVEVVEGLQ